MAGEGCLVDGTPFGLPRFSVMARETILPHRAIASSSLVYFDKMTPSSMRLNPSAGFHIDDLHFTTCALEKDDVPKLKCVGKPVHSPKHGGYYAQLEMS